MNDSLNGLNEGAPVKYRGVTIGSVKRVMIRFNQATNDYAMPVVIELQKNLLEERLGEQADIFTAAALDERIQRGLRASLQAESLLTGVLYVEIHPGPSNAPLVYHQLKKLYPEIPSEPTSIQQLMSNLASLNIKSIETNVNALLLKLEDTVENVKMSELRVALTNLLDSVQRLVTSPHITNALAAVQPTLEQYRLLAEKLSSRVDPLADGLTNTLAEANQALAKIRGTADNLRLLLGPDSPLQNNLDLALQQLADAAKSISDLAEFLKQHPNALIAGRQILPSKP